MTEIILDGIAADRKTEAEAEIKKNLSNFFSEADNPVKSVIATNSFREKVCEITGKAHYDPMHEYGRAAGKTIPLRENGKLVFVLVFDAAIFGRWLPEEKIFRTVIFAHELNHAHYEYFVWKRIGTDAFFKEPEGFRGSIVHSASIIWQEYDSCRLVMTVLAETASQFKGTVQDTMTVGNTQQLYDTIKGMRSFAKQSIEDYGKGKMPLEKLGQAISSRANHAIILWAYTVPAVGIIEDVTKKYAEIEKLDDYELFSDGLKQILLLVEELYNRRNEYLPDLIDRIADEIDLIYRKCGLTFTDLRNNGVYLSVGNVA